MRTRTVDLPLLLAGMLAVLALVGCGGDDDGSGAADAPTAVVAPVPLPGPYPVACSNVAQDFARAGGDAEAYWEGRPDPAGTPRYVADLLSDSANTLSVSVTAPDVGSLYGSYAGKTIGFAVLVCYPTNADNSRADYPLPTGQAVPRMQIGADAPLLADASLRYPVLAFSHGLAESPLGEDHFRVLSWLASHGYVVVAPFHGDPRFTRLQIDDVGDAVAALRDIDDAVAMQALRPLAMSAALDLVSTHPQWRDHVDVTQIGGFGASLGGETLLLMGGAALTTSLGLGSSPVGTDARLKAAVGYVPYFGQPLLPAFGRDQRGLERVTLPFLAISGSADTTAPLQATREGIERLQGPRQLVVLAGVEHRLDPTASADMLTWSLTFLDAQVRGLARARVQQAEMGSVAGGGDDHVLIPWNGP